MSESGEKVQLTIRCAMQSFEDRMVEVPLDLTVLEFKQHLFKTFPSKPEVTRQRLIYAGHCLENSKTLRSILQARSDAGVAAAGEGEGPQVQVIHLVCANKDAFLNSSSSSGEVRYRQNAAAAGSAAASPNTVPLNQAFYGDASQQQPVHNQVPPQNIYEAYAASYQNYMNQMTAMMQQQHQLYIHQNAVGGGQMMFPNLAQNFAMPQLGGQQMFLGAQPHNFALGAAALGAIHPAQQMMGMGHMGMFQPQHFMHQNNQQQQQQVVPVRPIPANLNGEGRQPDLLDLVYKSIRFALLMMVLYLYSSLERFFFVLLMIGMIWFVQMRRERRSRNPQEAQMQQQQRNPGPANDNNNNNELTPDRMPGGADGAALPADGGAGGAAPTLVEENQMNAWTVFWSTVSSFFTSLIPENPIPVDVN